MRPFNEIDIHEDNINQDWNEKEESKCTDKTKLWINFDSDKILSVQRC